jgi:hypothetical protein
MAPTSQSQTALRRPFARIKTFLGVVVFAWISVGGSLAEAGTITFSGYVDDAANTNLVGADLGTPLFADDFEIANNVALYVLAVAESGIVTFDSNGVEGGGIDPYFTLFNGATTSATFVESNYLQAFSTGGDFLISVFLAAGTYQVAIGTFANMSSAENLGAGTLGDKFTGLGDPNWLGNYYYELVVTTPAAVPEPASMLSILLAGAGLLGLARRMNS